MRGPPAFFIPFLFRIRMANVQYVSAERLELLKQELKELKTVKRKELVERIEAAKALGDLSENAEYHEAKDAMSLLEGRIFELDELFKNVQVIEAPAAGDKTGNVRVGSTVKVEVNGKEKTFQIVGSNEADPLTGKISNESPIGSALLGSKAGEAVEVTTPGGTTVYTIKHVE